MKLLFALMLGSILILASCSDNNAAEPVCNSVATSFSVNVKPIIDSKCATNSGCHGAGSSNGVYTTYSAINADKNKISSEVRNGTMPKNGSLTTDQKNTILCWIENGALNN